MSHLDPSGDRIRSLPAKNTGFTLFRTAMFWLYYFDSIEAISSEKRKEKQSKWQDQRTCGSVKPPIAATSTTPKEGIGREEYRKVSGLRICLRIGNAQSAVREKKCSGPLQDPVRWPRKADNRLNYCEKTAIVPPITFEL